MSSFTEKAQDVDKTMKDKTTGLDHRTNLKTHNETDFERMYGDGCKIYGTTGRRRCLLNEPCKACESNQQCRLHEAGYVYEASNQFESM